MVLIDIKENIFSYLLALPAIVYTFIFGYATLPYLYAAFIKIDYQKSIYKSDFIKFDNFDFIFKSGSLYAITRNTFRLNILSIVFVMFFAISIALLINELKNKKFIKINQSFMVLPYFISTVAISIFVFNLFSSRYGLVNSVLESLGMERMNWYSSPKPWVWIITGVKVWQGIGMSSVIYIAAIVSIDRQMYEAAVIDGANKWQQVFHITLPSIMPTIMILALLALGRVFYGDFGTIYAIIKDNGMLFPTMDIIETYVFRALRLTGNTAQAMSVSLLQAIFGFLLVFTSNYIVKRRYPDGALF